MNAFVRDGAVNRKRRVRPSSPTHRGIDPNRKKILKTQYGDSTTQSDRLNFGESTVDQSTSMAIETEKESRYSNADYIRAKAFVYLKFKKINPANVNKALKEHLKRFDKDGTQLKKIFEQCYDLTKGSVKMSEGMMKQLETKTFIHLTNVSSRTRDRLFNNSCKKVVEKTVKRNNITKDKKLMSLTLKKIIDDKILMLFGKFNLKNDMKTLYSNTILQTVPENDISHDNTCRITKSYSIRTTQHDSFGKTKISKPNTNCIVRENHISCIDNPVNGVKKIEIPQLKIDGIVQNAREAVSETNILVEKCKTSLLKIDDTIQNTKELALKIVDDDDVEEIMSPRLIIDETVESIEECELKIAEEITLPQLNMENCVNNVKDSALEIVSDGGEIMIPQLRIDETIQNAKELVLEIVDDDDDVREIMSPRLIIDETVESIEESELKIAEQITVPQLNMENCVNNVKDSALEIVSDDGEIMIPQLRIDETIQNAKELVLEIVDDDGEIMVPQLKMDGNIEDTISSALETNIDVNEIENTNDMNQKPEILKDFINIVLKIGRLIDPEDEIFKNSIIKDLATYFLNDDFLSKVDTLFNTTESDLVGELIVKLLDMFNDSQFNMAPFSGCLISVFREIALKSSIPPCKMKLKLIVFLDAIKKYIRVHDYGLYRSWFLPSMFFDWCFFVAYIFMNTNKDFIIDLNKKSIIKNAALYYNMVKQSKYLFINQDSKPNKTLKKSGIFELTRIDDLLEIDDVHTKKNENQIIPNISVNIPFKKPKHNKLKVKNENCIETINLTNLANDEEKQCPSPVNCNIYVNPKYNDSNSFIKPLDWFSFDVTELRNQLNATISDKSNESSIVVQNNTTNVDNNIQPIASNFGSVETSVKNKSRKRKKSTQVESPRVYFTVANNPKQFNLTFGSSVVTQNSSSSSNPQNTSLSTIPQNASQSRYPQNTSSSQDSPSSRSSKVPRKSRSPKNLRKLSSSTIPQNENLLSILQNPYSPTVSQNSNSLTFPQYKNSSTVPTNRSSYNNNNLTNNQYPETLQTVIHQSLYSSTAPLNPYSPTVNQNSSSLTFPQRPRSLAVPQDASLLTIPQNPYSSTFHQKSSSLTIPQHSSSSAVPQCESLLTMPQNPYSNTVYQNSSSLTFPQRPRSLAVPQDASLLTIPQNPYSSTVPQNPHSPTVNQNSSSLTIPQHSSSSTVPQCASLLTMPQNPYSNTVYQNSSSLTLPQRPRSLAVPQDASLLTVPQNPYSSTVPQNPHSPTVNQNSSSLTIPQHSSSSTVPQCASLLTMPQNPYSNTVYQNSSSLTLPQRPRSLAVPQDASLLTVPQNPHSPTVNQNSSSLTIPQHSSSSTVPQCASLLTMPQNPYSNTVHQNSNSLTFPQRPRSLAVPQNASLLTIPQNPYSSTVHQKPYSPTVNQNSSSLTIPQHSSSTAVHQCASLLTIPQNPYSPTFHQKLSSFVFPQNSCTLAVPQHISPYYNNFSSNHTQIPIGFRKGSSITNTTKTSNSKNTPLPVFNNLQSSITTLPPVSSNKCPQNLYHQSAIMNALCSMVANVCSSNVSNTSNVIKNPYFENSCRHCAHYTPYTGYTQSDLQSPYNKNIPFTTSQHSNASTCTTNHVEPISRDLVRNTQTSEASINNAYIQKLNDKYNNFNHGSSLVNQNNLQTPEYNPQVSPDLPDARLPNMPNLQDSDTRNKTCMAANCTNISRFRCEICMAAFYCSTQCQTTDLHYHKNECQRF